MKIKLALPKGSLEKSTYEFVENAGYRIHGKERTYRPALNDPDIEVKILRPQEIPLAVAEGMQDIGITGEDWVLETRADVEMLLKLEYGKIRVVVAIPKPNPASNFTELLKAFHEEQRTLRISTEYLNATSDYIMKNSFYREKYGDEEPLIITPWWRRGSNSKVAIFLSFGATEAKPPEDADVIFDVTETGSTLEQNNLKIIEDVLRSSSVFIANKKSMRDHIKREKIFDVMTLFKGVVEGRQKIHIFLNVRKENLKALLDGLPALKRPTVSELSDKAWYSVNTIIGKDEFLKILPTVRKLAQGLVVHTPRQILSLEEISKNENKTD